MIDLRDLQFLTALARHRHFAKAAREVGVSQPAFSMRIRKLEQRLGVSVVRRGNRFQGLTAEGEAVLQHARRILDSVRALDEAFRAAGREVTGALSLGVIPTAAAYAAQLAERLHARFPGVRTRIETATSLAIQQGIEDGAFDAGVTYTDGASADLLEITPVYDERYVLLAPEPLAPRLTGAASWAEASALPLVLLEPGMQNRRILDAVFEAGGLRPQIFAETGGFTAAMVLAARGVAATVVPQVLADALGPPPGTVVLGLTDPVIRKSVSLVTAQRRPDVPTVAALREVAAEA